MIRDLTEELKQIDDSIKDILSYVLIKRDPMTDKQCKIASDISNRMIYLFELNIENLVAKNEKD